MTLPELSGKATLDTSEFRQGIATIKSSLATISEKAGTLKITADLRGAKQAITDIDVLRTSAAAPIRISADGAGLRDVSRIVKELQGQVKTVRDLWQTRAITDEEAALASQRLRNELLKLAAAEDAGADSVLKATRAAAQAQRTLNQARGETTKGGFAFNTSLGILDALGKLGGPAGAAAGLIGRFVTDGLSSGIDKGAPEVIHEVEGLSDDVVLALKRKLQIQSPSRVMEELGRFIIDGLIVGFKSGRDEMKAALDQVASDIPNTFTGGVFDADLAAPLIEGLDSSLSIIPELFAKIFIQAAEPAQEALDDLGGEVELNVTSAFDGLGAGFEKASAALSGMTVTADDTAESLNDVSEGTTEAGGAAVEAGNGFEKLGNFLAVAGAGVAAFSAALAVSLPLASEFQTALRAISAESDLTTTDLKEIGDGLLGVSDDLGVSATALAKASYDIVGASVRGGEANSAVVDLARQSAELAGAGMSNVAVAADTLTSALNAYGLSAVSATRVSDILFQTTNVGKISLDQMGGSMNTVFPLAAALGVNLETLGASVAALTSVGVPANEAVTSIQSALSNILKPSAEASEAAASLGVGFDAATLKAKGLPRFLNDITVAAKGNSAVMSQLFGDVNAVNAVFALTSDVGARKFTEALDAMANANGATARGFAEVADSYEQSQQRFQNSIQNIQIEFASRFLPTLTALTDGTTAFIKNIDTFGDNTVVQFVAVTGGAVLLANTFIKLSVAIKEAAAATALFQAVSNAGGIQAYLASIGGLAGSARTIGLLGRTGAATIPVLTASLGTLGTTALVVGAAFAGWKVGEWIGKLKLFGDATTTVNDKLTDFFATTLFGADPEIIKEMRQQEEAEQARALAAGDTAGAYDDVAASVRAAAAAEAAAIEAQNKAAAQREAEINRLNTQKAALDDLAESLKGRSFTLELKGKTDLQKALAEVGKSYDELREKVSKPFEGDLKNPELLAGLKQLQVRQRAEESALRKSAADQAVETAQASALATQKAEIEAMRDGAAKKKSLRDQEIADIQRAAKKEAEGLADFPKQQEQIKSDVRKVITAKQLGWAEEDKRLAIETGERVASAENAARDAAIGAMEEGRAKREAVRNAELEDLKASIAEKVQALEGDTEAQRQVQASGDREIAARERQQNRQRVKDAQDTARLIQDAEAAARDGQIAAMEDGLAKREAIRARDLEALKKNIAEKVAALAGDPEAQGRVQASGQQEINAKVQEQIQQRVQEERSAQDQVTEARKAARDAEIAAIQDEGQRREAERQKELEGVEETARKRVEALAGYPEKQKAILAAAQQEARNLQQRYAQEDAPEATARAQRIADAFLKAQDAQFAAEKSGRDNQAAQYELALARRLAAVQDNAVKTAQIEQDALVVRARQAEAAAQAQYVQDQQTLASTRDRALSDTKLSADERTAIWRTYYADLNQLSGAFQAGEKQRLAQQERDARQAAEAVRIARIGEANRPIEQSQSRIQELQQSRELAASDAELLTIAQQISAEREKQITLLSQQLAGAGGVNLKPQERADVEEKIRAIQHDQAVTLKDQQATQQALRESTLSRLDAEAQYAERVARTSAELEAARQKQLGVAQARLRELDGQIAAEGQEEKRNALTAQRFTLLGQISDLTGKINAQPLEDDRRRLKLYEAQAQVKLIASGLQDDEASRAKLALQIAAQELLYANAQVAAAQNKLETDAAVTEQAQARLTLAQAYAAVQAKAAQTPLSPPTLTPFQDPRTRERELRQQALDDLGRELELQNKLQDVAEAHARGLAQVRGFADDAVGSAALELRLTRERLALTEQQLGRNDLGAAGRADLLKQQTDLLLKEEEQQRKLNDTRRAAARLTGELERAEDNLSEALAGGNAESNKIATATREVTESRRLLTVAEREYAQAKRDAEQVGSPANLEKLKTATIAVADAVGNHRTAVRNLAGEYRSLIGQMDGVREAGDRLRQVAYGDTQPFNAAREQERLSAIAQRRDAAQRELAQALSGGQPEQIARATEELTKQQERYNRQIEVLGKNGVRVSDLGQRETQRLANAVDALGIQYDREAVTLAERARITDQEAENALTLQGAAETFEAGTDRLVAALEGTYANLSAALAQDKKERDQQVAVDRELAQRPPALAVPTLPPRQIAATALPQLNDLDRLANNIVGGIRNGLTIPPVTVTDQAAKAIGTNAGASAGAAVAVELAKTSAIAPINNYAGDTYYMTVNGAPGQSAEAVADIAIRKLEDRARRAGRNC